MAKFRSMPQGSKDAYVKGTRRKGSVCTETLGRRKMYVDGSRLPFRMDYVADAFQLLFFFASSWLLNRLRPHGTLLTIMLVSIMQQWRINLKMMLRMDCGEDLLYLTSVCPLSYEHAAMWRGHIRRLKQRSTHDGMSPVDHVHKLWSIVL